MTGLSGLSKSTEFIWYGWPGLEVPEAEAGHLSDRLLAEWGAVPVYLNDTLADLYYNGFASKSDMNNALLELTPDLKTPFCGHCSITILGRLPSVRMLGQRIKRQTGRLPKLLLETYEMAISSGYMTTI